MKKSALQRVRADYQPKLPFALQGPVKIKIGEKTQSVADQEEIARLFPNTYGLPVIEFERDENPTRVEEPFNVGIILSGGQAPGGHNVVSGIFDGIKSLNRECRLYGFLMGPSGFVNHQYMELTAGIIKEYRNTGGFDKFRTETGATVDASETPSSTMQVYQHRQLAPGYLSRHV